MDDLCDRFHARLAQRVDQAGVGKQFSRSVDCLGDTVGKEEEQLAARELQVTLLVRRVLQDAECDTAFD